MVFTEYDKNAKKRNMAYAIIFCVLLSLVIDLPLIIVGILYPGFLAILLGVAVVYTLVVIYFTIIRAVTLNRQSKFGYSDSLVCLYAGFPFVTNYTVKREFISHVESKDLKGLYGKNLVRLTIYTRGERFVYNNLNKETASRFITDIEEAKRHA